MKRILRSNLATVLTSETPWIASGAPTHEKQYH